MVVWQFDIDATYLEFLEELKAPKTEDIDKKDIEYMLSKKEDQPKITPLLQAIKIERERKALKKQIKKAKNPSGSGRGMRSFDNSQPKPVEQISNVSSGGGGSSKRKKKKKPVSGEEREQISATSNRDLSGSGTGIRSKPNETRDLPPSSSKGPRKFTLTKKDGSTKTF